MRRALPLMLIVAFAALMALCAQINVPMAPVPMTMQTFAVLLTGAVLGPWRGTASVLLYLAAAALGLPILSDGASGVEPFAGPTAGYLFAFPVAAALVGAMFDRARNPVVEFGLMIAAHILILTMGAGWLAISIGLTDALAYGATPFLIGMIVKSVLVVAVMKFLPFRGGGPRSGGGAPATRTI
ncbi:biotin transporter BioY [Brevundimonas kwangchunensis]|uniref:Biotin transporter n=1 Tax=Brevundimonas kwangchunensis TaxID=322163 RepID=A0ABN1H5P7_9CAUL